MHTFVIEKSTKSMKHWNLLISTAYVLLFSLLRLGHLLDSHAFARHVIIILTLHLLILRDILFGALRVVTIIKLSPFQRISWLTFISYLMILLISHVSNWIELKGSYSIAQVFIALVSNLS